MIKATKGSKSHLIGWTPRLREAIDRALELPSKIGTMRLMHNQHGQKYRYDAFNSA